MGDGEDREEWIPDQVGDDKPKTGMTRHNALCHSRENGNPVRGIWAKNNDPREEWIPDRVGDDMAGKWG